MHTELLTIERSEQFTAAVKAAAELLRRGQVVAVPTETVYGLAANALDSAAVERIYEAKGRPRHNPIIVHVASLSMAQNCARSWSERAQALSRAFWPGPLTIVVPKADSIPSIVTAEGETVGVRWPLHPFMQELIRQCDFPIAAPSANLANELSPTNGDHVFKMLRGKIPLIVDAGPCSVGIESTVLDLSTEQPRILRPGMISAEQISRVLGIGLSEKETTGGPLKSPGLLRKHYAPRAPLQLASWHNETELKQIADRSGTSLSKISIIAHDKIPRSNPFGRVAIIPHDPEAYARAIYAELHLCDQLGAGLIIVEKVPSGEEWRGIRDRLTRASAHE